MPTEPRLRDRLCELEPQNPLLRERYHQEVRAMLERKLTVPGKVFVAAVGVGSVAIAAYLGHSALVHTELPALARAGLAGGAVFAAAWALLCGRTLRRGAFELLTQPAAMAGLAWAFAVLLETCFLVLAPQFPDPFQATVALFCGLVILVGAGVMLVTACVQQAALRTQEALLRLEYRIAEMAETRTASDRP